MFPHLDTESRLTDMRRREALTKAARYRFAAHGEVGLDGKHRTRGTLRRQLGAALVRVGSYLQGGTPIDVASHPSGLVATSGPRR